MKRSDLAAQLERVTAADWAAATKAFLEGNPPLAEQIAFYQECRGLTVAMRTVLGLDVPAADTPTETTPATPEQEASHVK